MAELKYAAFTSDGARVALPEAAQWELIRSYDSPADSLLTVFPLTAPFPSFCRVTAETGGTPVFDGLVDEQETACTLRGCFLTVSARSRGALLLDNEACPACYEKPTLGDLYRLHGAPYGLTGYDGDVRCPSAFAVEKGMSEWEVFQTFCRGVLGVVPRITPELRLDARGLPAPGPPLFFSNRDGIAYTRARVLEKRCALLSEIACKPEGAGGYSVRVRDRAASDSGIRARRFINLANQPPWLRERLPKLLLRDARQEAFSIRLRVPFAFGYPVGRAARLEDEVLGRTDGLMITQTEYRAGPTGLTCAVTLNREEDMRCG